MKLTTKNQDPLNYIEANAILHKIGNQKPYFSLTGRIVEKGEESVSGTIHEEILKVFPEIADIASLHLSDIDGKPMHSFENGKYWAGFTDYQDEKPEHLASHWRIGKQRSQELMYEALVDKCNEIKADTGEDILPDTLLKDFHDRQIPRWKQEADAVIRKYKLEIN